MVWPTDPILLSSCCFQSFPVHLRRCWISRVCCIFLYKGPCHRAYRPQKHFVIVSGLWDVSLFSCDKNRVIGDFLWRSLIDRTRHVEGCLPISAACRWRTPSVFGFNRNSLSAKGCATNQQVFLIFCPYTSYKTSTVLLDGVLLVSTQCRCCCDRHWSNQASDPVITVRPVCGSLISFLSFF